MILGVFAANCTLRKNYERITPNRLSESSVTYKSFSWFADISDSIFSDVKHCDPLSHVGPPLKPNE